MSLVTRPSRRRTAYRDLRFCARTCASICSSPMSAFPVALNGRQMADAARENRPDLKVLFITGYAENAAIGNGYLEPGMHVLTKPFAMDMLAARIRSIIAA